MNQASVTHNQTQVSLPSDLYGKAKRLAREHDDSLVGVIRKALNSYVSKHESQAKNNKKQAFEQAKKEWMDLAGIASGPSDLAKRHDSYW